MCRADDRFMMFVISPGARDARDWARRFWDTYHFDWDTERSTTETVYAWAGEGQTEDGLIEALQEDSVDFETQSEGPEEWFDFLPHQGRFG